MVLLSIERTGLAVARRTASPSESGGSARLLAAAVSLAGGLSLEIHRDSIGAYLVNAVIEALDARRVIILIDGSEIVADRQQAAHEWVPSANSSPFERLPKSLMDEASRTKSIAIVEACSGVADTFAFPEGVGEAICVPLISCADVLGLMYVELDRSHQFVSEVTHHFLGLAACQCAVALSRFDTGKVPLKTGRCDADPPHNGRGPSSEPQCFLNVDPRGKSAPNATLTEAIIDPLSCIMLDAQAAVRWLGRKLPDVAMATSSLMHIEKQAKRIVEALEQNFNGN